MVKTAQTEFLSPSFWRVTLALVCVLAAVSLMNMAVFSLFDPVFTYARDISQTVQAIVFVGIGMLATFKPQAIR